jgi:hypothetical protein
MGPDRSHSRPTCTWTLVELAAGMIMTPEQLNEGSERRARHRASFDPEHCV